MSISETTWNLLWSVEYADSESPGCANHGEQDCLCDVDLAHTADLEWNQAPRDLALIETVDDFIEAAAEMLIRTDIAANRRTLTNHDERMIGLDEADPADIEQLMVLMAEHPEYGATRLNALSNLSQNQIVAIRNLLGRKHLQGGQHAEHLNEVAKLARQGMPNTAIVQEMARRGVKLNLWCVQQSLARRGITSVRMNTWQLRQRIPDVLRLRAEGMSWQAIADELGTSKTSVRRAYAAHQRQEEAA